MKRSFITSILLISTLGLLNNCTGNEAMPNNATQTGVAVGTVTGAVVGYNVGGGDRGRNAVIGAAVGAVAGGAIGNSIDEQNPPVQEDGGWE